MKTKSKHITKNKNSTRGFTLLETLVAIAILSIVIGTVMGLIQSSLIADAYAKDQITAKYLAEEGVEYIRNLRDTNFINFGQGNWMKGIAEPGGGVCGNVNSTVPTNTCYVDPINIGMPTLCNQASVINGVTYPCPFVYYDSNTGEYSYQGGVPSKFVRTITVVGDDFIPGTAVSAKVESKVYWAEGNKTLSYTIDDYLYNWYKP